MARSEFTKEQKAEILAFIRENEAEMPLELLQSKVGAMRVEFRKENLKANKPVVKF